MTAGVLSLRASRLTCKSGRLVIVSTINSWNNVVAISCYLHVYKVKLLLIPACLLLALWFYYTKLFVYMPLVVYCSSHGKINRKANSKSVSSLKCAPLFWERVFSKESVLSVRHIDPMCCEHPKYFYRFRYSPSPIKPSACSGCSCNCKY